MPPNHVFFSSVDGVWRESIEGEGSIFWVSALAMAKLTIVGGFPVETKV